MQNRYFNESEFTYAMKLFENDPYQSKERLESYINKYPTDYYARAYYVILLTRLCLFDEAENEFNNIISESNNDHFYDYSSEKKLRGFKYNMCIAQLKLLGASEKYDEAYAFFKNHPNIFSERDKKYISYVCRSKLGWLNKDTAERNKDAYRFNQTIDYSEERFREHVKKHEADYNMDAVIPNGTIFATDFPIDKIIDEIKKCIPSNKRLFPGYFDDTYCFKFDNCGRINNSMTDYFTVVCFHNTAEFITMYPSNDCQRLPSIDLNYLKEKEDNKTEDRLSQIEKFNRRYGRK